MVTNIKKNWRQAREESAIISATFDTVGDTLAGDVDFIATQSVSVQVAGAFTGTILFEVSNDGVNWAARSLVNSANAAVSQLTAPGLASGDIGSRYFRVRASALTTGTPLVTVIGFSESQANTLASQTVAVTGVVAEDAALASGASGLPVFGQRVPTTPAAQTSAAGDAGLIALTSEGKVVQAGQGAEEVQWQASTDFTATADTALKASAGAGVRNYLTDITLENTGAAEIRVLVKDGSTRVLAATLAAKQTLNVQLKTPIRGTAATAINVALSVAGTVSVHASGYIGV